MLRGALADGSIGDTTRLNETTGYLLGVPYDKSGTAAFTGWSSRYRILYTALLLTLTFMYLILGMVFYHAIEGFSWLDSFFFCAVTLGTVGYGWIAPQTVSGRVWTIFYSAIGLFLLVGQLSSLLDKSWKENVRQRSFARARKETASYGTAGADTEVVAQPLSAWHFWAYHVLMIMTFLSIWILGPGASLLYWANNGSISFFDSIYYSWTTATTLGFGSHITTLPAKIWCSLYTIANTIVFTGILSYAVTRVSEREVEIRQHRIASPSTKHELLKGELLEKLQVAAKTGKLDRHNFITEFLVHHALIERVEMQLLSGNRVR